MLAKLTPVFKIAAGIMLILVIVGMVWPDWLEQVTTDVQGVIANAFGWYYLIVVTFLF
nr:BCCT family transporter [Piscibacillus salipiscarius]